MQRDEPLKRFQYILCYGSTFMEENESLEQIHFNTSYVTVQQTRF